MDWVMVLSLLGITGFLALAMYWRSGRLQGVVRRLETQLRQRERDLRGSEARLDEFLVALETSPNGLILLDERARIEWCNRTAATHFGLEPARDLQQYIGNLVRDPAFAAYMTSWNYGRDLTLTVPAGPTGFLRLSVQLHAYAGNRRLLLSRDITAAEMVETMRRDFVANVSHEIRTPLTVLTGFVETLQSLDLGPEDRSRYLGMMAQQAQRMQTLVNDLLTLSRLEGSPLPGTGDWVPATLLSSQCEQEAAALSAMLGRHQVLDFAPAPEIELAGAANELQSAVSNLVSNAVRYTPAGGTVSAGWREADHGRMEFAVRDTGPGIDAEHIPRLTERFYRVDRSRSRETGGTGLGLAIVKHVAQRHGAELRIVSAPGAGSTFSLLFPASRVRPAATRAGTSARPATESAAG